MSDGREWIALLRRHYFHVLAGGRLTDRDLARHVEAAEKADAEIERLRAEVARLQERERRIRRGECVCKYPLWNEVGSCSGCGKLRAALAEEGSNG